MHTPRQAPLPASSSTVAAALPPGIRGIEASDRGARAYLFGDPVLEQRHRERLFRHLVCDLCRDHDHALAVADDDVTRKDRNVAASDGNVQVDRMMMDQVGGRRRQHRIGRHRKARDFG